MKSRRLRAGVVGVGSMGENHARIYSRLPDIELAGIYDVNGKRAAEVAERFGTVAFKELEDLLYCGLDLVSVAVPASSHCEVVLPCARAGCHVLLEKPLADSLEHAEKIMQECELNGVRLMVGHVERFNPVVQAIRKTMKADEVISIGITRVGPKPPRIRDVGVIKDMGIHDIDLIRYLTGKEIVSSYSLTAGEENKEEACVMLFQLEGDVLAHLTVNWITPFKVRRMEVASSSSFIEGDLMLRKARHYKRDHKSDVFETSELPIMHVEPLEEEIKTFVHCLREGKDFPVSPYDAYRALEVADYCTSKPGELIACHPEERNGGISIRAAL